MPVLWHKQPGYAATCQGCKHLDLEAKQLGHTNPCGKVGWFGASRCSRPTISDDGRECDMREEVLCQIES